MAERAVLLVSTPIEKALSELDGEAERLAGWEGERAPGVIAIRRCVAVVRQGMKAAEELWVPISEASRVSGWSDPTITKYCALLANGEEVPHEWAAMDARLAATGGYLVRPSTIPPKPARRKAG